MQSVEACSHLKFPRTVFECDHAPVRATQVYARSDATSKTNMVGKLILFTFIEWNGWMWKLKVRLLSDIKPEAPKYHRRTLQKQPLCIMRLVTKLQQLNYERRRNSFTPGMKIRPPKRDSSPVRRWLCRPTQSQVRSAKFYQFFNLKSELLQSQSNQNVSVVSVSMGCLLYTSRCV